MYHTSFSSLNIFSYKLYCLEIICRVYLICLLRLQVLFVESVYICTCMHACLSLMSSVRKSPDSGMQMYSRDHKHKVVTCKHADITYKCRMTPQHTHTRTRTCACSSEYVESRALLLHQKQNNGKIEITGSSHAYGPL